MTNNNNFSQKNSLSSIFNDDLDDMGLFSSLSDSRKNFMNLTTGNLFKQQQQLMQNRMQEMNNSFKGLLNNNGSNNINSSLNHGLKGLTNNSNEVAINTKKPEEEVDLLKDLLIKNLNTNNTDTNFYGVCLKCNDKIIGADNGLKAMDQLFHTNCFTCHGCGKLKTLL